MNYFMLFFPHCPFFAGKPDSANLLLVLVFFKHAVIQTINTYSRRGQFHLLFEIGLTPRIHAILQVMVQSV